MSSIAASNSSSQSGQSGPSGPSGHENLSLPISAGALAALLGGELVGNPDTLLSTLGSIEDGTPETLTFIRSASFAKLWDDSACGCALVSKGIEVHENDLTKRAIIRVADADEAMVTILDAINPKRVRPAAGIHGSAVVDAEACVDPSASIGPGCVVGAASTIGAGAVLMSNVTVGAGVVIGRQTILEPGVVVEDRCVIGDRCHLGANSVIGSDGFGFLPPTDSRPAIKVPQIGGVRLGDDIELGACVTIDRAKFGQTTIGDRTKIDNQVHVGHNCIVGTDTLICGRTTLGGSVTVGDFAMIGGAVVLNDHATVGKNARVAGGAIVLEEVPEGETYAGIPAMPARQALLNYSSFRDLSSFMRKVEKHLKKASKNESS